MNKQLSRLGRTFSLCVSLAGLGIAIPALAANTAPVSGMDGRSTGSVNTAETIGDGGVTSTIAVETSTNALTDQAMGVDTSDPASRHVLLERSNTAAVTLGYGIGHRVELGLTLRGVYETMSESDRQGLFASQEAASGNSVAGQQRQGFGGATAMLKTKIVGNDWIVFSVAPFVDSGAGSRADYSVTRSSDPTAGWLAMMTLGQNSPVELNMNGGWRYRNGSETVGDYRLRNEALYQGSVTFHATRWMGLWVAGQGRRLMMAENAEGQPLDYHASTGGNATAGLTFKFGDMAVAGFGGRAVKKDSFGFGQTVAGLSVSYVIGGRHAPGFAREISENISESDIVAPVTKRAATPEVTVYPEEMSGKFDPMAELEKDRAAGKTEKDDFDVIEARMAKERAQGTSSIAFEDELAKLRAEEAKMDIERAKKRAVDDRAERAREAKNSKQRNADKVRYEREAKAAAAKLPSIKDEDYNWGLE